MYDVIDSESKRVNKLNTVLWSCCLKQLYYGIHCLIFILYVIRCPNLMTGLKTKKIISVPKSSSIKVIAKCKNCHQILLSQRKEKKQ